MRIIDVEHLGRPRVIGCWQVDDVLIDPGPASTISTLLAHVGDRAPRAVLLTHIHLDHAGASGSLVERFPGLEVYVHERGAAHLIDPSRLLDSAARLYGEDMDRLWGEVLPVPETNLRILSGGERILDGAYEVAYTPGHASHHVSYRHGDIAFVGDVGGVRITPESLTIPPTPPPDIDLDAWYESIERIKAWSPQELAFTHFGASTDPIGQLDEVARRLEDWADRVREQDRDPFIAGLVAEIEDATETGTLPAYVQAAPPEQLYAGLERYWRKRAEALPGPAAPPVF